MSSESVLADVIAEHMPEGDGGQDGQVNRDIAAQGISALRAAGYAVVELPKQCIVPTGWGEDCLGAWPATSGDDPVSAWPQRQVVTPDDKWISPRDARSLAAALLAAADAAESQA